MRTVALGLIAAAGIAMAAPAAAQGVYVGAGPVGVGVGVGPGPGYYDDGYYGPRYAVPYRDGYRYDRDYAYAGDCRVKIIRHGNGSVTRIRRCD
jgi:hypothetical protein